MTDLTERLIALRDAPKAGVAYAASSDSTPADRQALRDTLAEAANRIAELEAAASSRHDPELPLTTRIALDRAEEAEAERDRLKAEQELAWAAGLFDGEGSFMLTHNSRPDRHPKARATLSMTNETLVRRFAAAVGVGTVTGPEHRERERPMWRWTANRYEHFERVLALLGPWLGTEKKAKADDVKAGHVHTDNTNRHKNLGAYAMKKEDRP